MDQVVNYVGHGRQYIGEGTTLEGYSRVLSQLSETKGVRGKIPRMCLQILMTERRLSLPSGLNTVECPKTASL